MGDAAHIDLAAPRTAPRSKRLLRLAGDDRLVAQIRRGNEAAFEVAFERHGPGVLAFCRHMLGSPEEAEDAVQQSFAAAYRDLQRDEREIVLKPWLYTIARNRCLSILRARRELPDEQPEIVTAGLAEQVEQRAELRQLVADIRDLPDEQRAALLLAEVGDLAHTEIASVLGCEVARVKALVFRARSGLIARREARDLPCEQVREQLSELRGGSLRRTELRLHLRECPGCREFREQVKHQRKLMAVALPVVPTFGLKSSVLAAVGIGGGGAAAGGAAAGGGAALGASLAGVAKVAAVALVAAGGTAVVVKERESAQPSDSPPAAVKSTSQDAAPATAQPPVAEAGDGSGKQDEDAAAGRARGREAAKAGGERRGHGRENAPGQLKARGESAQPLKPEHAGPKGNARGGRQARGRGPVEAPPKDTPVRRGPAEPKVIAPKLNERPEQAAEPQGKANGRPQQGAELE
jgi:RNA polymerase sigma factor (sigma-70 family)